MKLTVFTPTYNRSNTLERCYESIVSQNFLELEWLIIDDGSTDNTRNIVDRLKKENKIVIKYIYQENKGKQYSWNKALDYAKGDFFIGLDSDDTFVSGCLHKLFDKISILDKKNIIGIRGIAINSENKEPSNNYLYTKNKTCSWFNEFASVKNGERIDLFKTITLKKFKYPVTKEIKFIPEIWFYAEISNYYNFYYSSIPVRVFHDNEQNNRLSKSSIKQNALGHYIARKSLLKNLPIYFWFFSPIKFIKTIIRINQALLYICQNTIMPEKGLVNIVTFPSRLYKKYMVSKR